MNKKILSSIFMVCIFMSGIAFAENLTVWKEEDSRDGYKLFIDAQLNVPSGQICGVWGIKPGVISETEAQRMANILFGRTDCPLKKFTLAKDFESSDKAEKLYTINYFYEPDEILHFSNYTRNKAAATQSINYFCESRNNDAESASRLMKNEGAYLWNGQKPIENIVGETNAAIKQLAPDFELFATGILGREAVNASERKHPEKIPKMLGFVYTRKVDNLPVLYQYNENEEPELIYLGLKIPSEKITVMAGDNGIAEMNFQGYLNIEKEPKINVSLLDTKQIKNIAKDELFKWMESEGRSYADKLYINSVKLGYRIQNDESETSGSLIPVWNFYGNTGKSKAEYGEALCECILTIDAVTGEAVK